MNLVILMSILSLLKNLEGRKEEKSHVTTCHLIVLMWRTYSLKILSFTYYLEFRYYSRAFYFTALYCGEVGSE